MNRVLVDKKFYLCYSGAAKGESKKAESAFTAIHFEALKNVYL